MFRPGLSATLKSFFRVFKIFPFLKTIGFAKRKEGILNHQIESWELPGPPGYPSIPPEHP